MRSGSPEFANAEACRPATAHLPSNSLRKPDNESQLDLEPRHNLCSHRDGINRNNLIREYRINGRKSIDHLKARWDLHLKPFFGVLRAVEVTSQLVAHYIDARRSEEHTSELQSLRHLVCR